MEQRLPLSIVCLDVEASKVFFDKCLRQCACTKLLKDQKKENTNIVVCTVR